MRLRVPTASDVPSQRRGSGSSTGQPVARSGLVGRLLVSSEPVVSVVAPPGFGKSMLLSSVGRAARAPRRVGLVRQDPRRPVFLCTAIVAAVSLVEPLGRFPTRHDAPRTLNAWASTWRSMSVPSPNRSRWCSTSWRPCPAAGPEADRGPGHGLACGFAAGLGLAGAGSVLVGADACPGSGRGDRCRRSRHVAPPRRRCCSGRRASSSPTRRRSAGRADRRLAGGAVPCRVGDPSG